MAETFEPGEEDLFEGALSAEQREGLCGYLKIPASSSDQQIVWAMRNSWKGSVTGISETDLSGQPLERPENIEEGEPLIEEQKIIDMIKKEWGGPDNPVLSKP